MGIVHFFQLARLAHLCSFLVEKGHRSLAPQSSQLYLQVQLAIPCCTVAQSTRFPISCSIFCPSSFVFSPQFAASCFNSCSMVAQHKQFLQLVFAFVPSHVGHTPSYPTPPIHIMDSRSLGHTTLAVPDIGSRVCPFVPLLFGSSPHFPSTYFQIWACRSQCFSVACHTWFPTLVPALAPLHFGSSTTIPRLHSCMHCSSCPAPAPQAPGCFAFLPRP
jgi:hypothetical protein